MAVSPTGEEMPVSYDPGHSIQSSAEDVIPSQYCEDSSDALASSSKRSDSKKCGVCGDRALGYNFNAITCESCKAFFRRNALKKKEFRCPFSDSCKVNAVTRRFCQKCRLKKCFDIGMKKEWIMSEEERMKKKQKIEQNRARKLNEISPSTPECESVATTFIPFTNSSLNDRPQAVVVGRIRTEDEVEAKKIKRENQIDVHTGTDSESTSSPAAAPTTVVESVDNLGTSPVAAHLYNENVEVEQSPVSLDEVEVSSASCSKPSRISLLINSPLSDGDASILPASSTSCQEMLQARIKEEENDIGDSFMNDFPSYFKNAQTTSWNGFSLQKALSHIQPGCKELSLSGSQSVMDSIVSTAISAEYSSFSLLASSNSQQLNEAEMIKLSELMEANKSMIAPLSDDDNFKELQDESLLNVINLTDIAIRRIIKMSKRISGFKNLCQDDQIALLKGGCTEILILRSVSAYNPDKDSWMIQEDQEKYKNIRLQVLQAVPGNIYEEHKKFQLSFLPEWRQDDNIMLLLSAIVLFTPERQNVIHGDAIRHEQCLYLFLIKRYLECKWGYCEGHTVYYRLLERIGHLHILNDNHVKVFLEVDPKDVEPLLIEIFDLKQRR